MIYSHDPDASRALVTFLADHCSSSDHPIAGLNPKVAIAAAAD